MALATAVVHGCILLDALGGELSGCTVPPHGSKVFGEDRSLKY